MSRKAIVLDLNFQNTPGTIASYLLPGSQGAVLVDCGPGSTTAALTAGLGAQGLRPDDVTAVLLTHIHLDHAGAAGWLARHGAAVYVHPRGAPHMINSERLIASATRIYGDDMKRLWGEFLPVPEERLVEARDGDEITIGDLRFEAVATPGHASHHIAWRWGDLCFTGDVAGVRLQGTQHVAPPMPPPDLNLPLWRESVARLRKLDPQRLALTHFGIFDDADFHLDAIDRALREADALVERVLPSKPSDTELRAQVSRWLHDRALADGVTESDWQVYEAADPGWMAAAGLRRYWRKHKSPDA